MSELGRREAALGPAEEAVKIRRKLAAANPDAYEPALASALNNLGTFLSELGRREAALGPAEEAVGLNRKLAAANPDAYEPDLASALNNLGTFLNALGRREAALDAAHEAVRTLAPQFLALPGAYGAWMMTMAQNYLERCEEVGREPIRSCSARSWRSCNGCRRSRSAKLPESAATRWTCRKLGGPRHGPDYIGRCGGGAGRALSGRGRQGAGEEGRRRGRRADRQAVRQSKGEAGRRRREALADFEKQPRMPTVRRCCGCSSRKRWR